MSQTLDVDKAERLIDEPWNRGLLVTAALRDAIAEVKRLRAAHVSAPQGEQEWLCHCDNWYTADRVLCELCGKTRYQTTRYRPVSAPLPAPTAEPLQMLRDWAITERDDWSERNADRYWQMNRVINEIQHYQAAPPAPIAERLVPVKALHALIDKWSMNYFTPIKECIDDLIHLVAAPPERVSEGKECSTCNGLGSLDEPHLPGGTCGRCRGTGIEPAARPAVEPREESQ